MRVGHAHAHSFCSARTISADAPQAQHFTCPPSPGHESESGATSALTGAFPATGQGSGEVR
eukprot:6175432-Pleurochrysis_carterae.AAC.1